MARQSERDRAPEGFITPQAAAEVLDVTDETIRNHLKSGKLEGTEARTGPDGTGETRYYVSAEAVGRILAERYGTLNGEITRRSVGLEVEDHARRYAEGLERLLDRAADERADLRANQTILAQGVQRQTDLTEEILAAERARGENGARIATTLNRLLWVVSVGIPLLILFQILRVLGVI